MVDVYSFGIASTHQNGYLIDEVKRKAERGQLLDLIDNFDEDLQSHGEEAVKIVEIAIRCLQPYNSRPSMYTVLKLLEGSLDVEPVSDCSFLGVVHDRVSPKMVSLDQIFNVFTFVT